MKHIRSRLSLYLYILIIVACIVSLTLSYLVRAGIIMVQDQVQVMLFGFALRDILLILAILLCVVAGVAAISRSTTNPIRTLNNATKEIAAGNFDVEVSIRNRAEEFAELQTNFNAMVRELRANEYLKKDFVSGVSHEMKTPLSIIGGYAKLLRDGEDLSEEERREYLDLIISETERLTSLTSNMLRLSRMDSEEIKPKHQRFSLDEQIREAVVLLEPKWSVKELEMDVDLAEVWAWGDSELLIQVWINLIGNAVKYTEKGGSLRIGLTETADKHVVTVADTGCGMNQEDLARAFDRFYQADTSRRKEGSGLGLAIVRRIVELHHGSVSAKSEPGQGSIFTVELPREKEETAAGEKKKRRRRRKKQEN